MFTVVMTGHLLLRTFFSTPNQFIAKYASIAQHQVSDAVSLSILVTASGFRNRVRYGDLALLDPPSKLEFSRRIVFSKTNLQPPPRAPSIRTLESKLPPYRTEKILRKFGYKGRFHRLPQSLIQMILGGLIWRPES